jgi:thioesterase domain-containing protein/acyl carrier protein
VAVVGGDDNPVPIGVRGELIIGGAGVVGGYLGDDGATAERFGVDDRLGRFFRTRDRAVLVDGTVHFLGRSDNQLNLGGVRAEPEEIERVLLDAGGVGAVVVVAVDSRPLSQLIESAPLAELSIAMARAATADDPAQALAAALREFHEPDLTLVAHVEAGAAGDVDVAALRARAQRDLPAALRPRRFVVHPSLPRSPMGKIDRAQVALLTIPDDDVEPGPVRSGDDQATATVCRLFRETLRISAVGDQDSFFDLGGHSLLALQLLARLNDVFATEVSVAALYDAPTPAALAQLVGAPSGPQSQLEYVVPIQPNGTRTPLFGVHVLGPNAEYYRPLSNRMGPDQPLYGLGLAAGLEDADAPTRVDEIAALYVHEIERVAPDGPVALAAVSLGAVAAFELAQSLRDRGRDVALIAFFDATGPEAQIDPETTTHWLRAHAEEFRTGAVQYFRDRRSNLNLRAERGRQRLEISLRQLVHAPMPDRLKIRRFIEANVAAALAHEASSYPGPICVFKAEEDPFGWGRGDNKLGWGSVATGSFNVVDVPGGHMSMLTEPHVGALARALSTELDRKVTPGALEDLATGDAIASRLRRALHSGTFSAAVADLGRSSGLDPAAADLVTRADAALRSVADYARSERDRIIDAFEAASVQAVAGDVPNRLEHASLTVTVDNPDQAIAVLVGLGYVMQHPMSPGAWRAYKRRQTSVTLITLDQATTRVHIVWGQDAESGA